MNLTAAIDLGLYSEHSAFAVVEKLVNFTGDFNDIPEVSHYRVVDLHRWAKVPVLIGGYPKIIRDLGKRIRRSEDLMLAPLYVDHAAPGYEVIPLFKQAWLDEKLGYMVPHAVTITGAKKTPRPAHGCIAKVDLITMAQNLVSEGLIQVQADLEFSAQLLHEIETYKIKPAKTGDEYWEAGRQGDHDDLLFSVLLAVFYSRRNHRSECRRWDPEPALTVGAEVK